MTSNAPIKLEFGLQRSNRRAASGLLLLFMWMQHPGEISVNVREVLDVERSTYGGSKLHEPAERL